MEHRLIAVLGTPCGGTRYTTQRLRAAGYDIQHEKMGEDGFCCGFSLCFRDKRPPGPHGVCLDDFEFQHTVRLIRNPLNVLETLPRFALRSSTIGQQSWHDCGDEVLAALRWWIFTYEALPEDAPVVRIEYFEEDFERLVASLDLEGGNREPLPSHPHRPGIFRVMPPRSKRQRWPLLTWDELHERYPEHAARAFDIAARFGIAEQPEPRTFVVPPPPWRVALGIA